MPRFAANLSMMFTEHPLVERFDQAAAAGFTAVEFLFPYGEDIDAIAEALQRNSLEQVLFNLPAGNFAAGDRGLANDPSRVNEFRDGVAQALEIAAKLNCTRLNCLTGLRGKVAHDTEQMRTLEQNLAYAAERTQSAGVLMLVEPINTIDAPGYFIGTPSAGFALVERIGHDNLKVQYDVYHAQRTEGNMAATLRERIEQIGHIQIADSPARNEPGTGEINFRYIFGVIDEIGYDSWVSAEYRPSGKTEDSLGWMRT